MHANSHSNHKSTFLQTLVIGIVVLFIGIAINLSLSNAQNPVSEQIAKAESETSVILPEPVADTSQKSSEQGTNPTSAQPAHLNEDLVTDVKSQIANGIEFTISNYSRTANHFSVDVCYDLPGPGIWDINGATLLYGPIKTSNFEFREISLQEASDTTPIGRRCANLDFPEIFTSEKSKTFTLSIEWLGLTNPSEGHECEEYLARGKETLAQQGIILQCNAEPSSFGLTVTSKPETMSQAQVDDLLSKIIYGVINGPWTFNGTVEN
ncbi:MAG TPA: hypothetical protein PK530_18455 [Anaerolineales bacterium]|nr:hypothetical protein [Anaerolineales bacterium]